jgi:hypothetical protein
MAEPKKVGGPRCKRRAADLQRGPYFRAAGQPLGPVHQLQRRIRFAANYRLLPRLRANGSFLTAGLGLFSDLSA